MAELIEGTYAVICVASGLALDVKGASDKSKTNVQQWNPNYTDAQIWALSNFSNGWQFKCSLTNKCLDINGASVTSGTNVQQYDDNNSRAQRWSIVSDNGTYTFNGKSYDTYRIHPYTNSGLSLAVSGSSTAAGANVIIWTNSASSQGQRWIFVPVSVFTEGGTYFICPVGDPSVTLDVASSSTANSANVVFWPMRESNNQIVRTVIDSETFNTTFYFAHSGKCLDVKGGNPANGTKVQQYQSNATGAQKWLPIKKGSVTYQGEVYPTYELVVVANSGFVLAAPSSNTSSGTQLIVWTRNNSNSQRFFFVKTEAIGNDISAPGNIEQIEFHRDGVGDVSVSDLTFLSKETAFQARYKVRKYTQGKKTYVDSEWMNYRDDSTSRSGWGDAWTSTFTATPVEERITIPFTKTVSLDATYQSAEFIVEVRTYKDSYGTGFKAHGPATSSTVKILQTPEVSVGTSGFAYDSKNGNFGITTELTDSLGNGCSFLRGRIIGGDGDPISDWQTSSNMTITHSFGGSLLRLPSVSESLTFEYSMLTNDGLSVSGKEPFTFTYSGSSTLSISYPDEEALIAVASSPSSTYEHCFIEVPYFGGTRLIENKKTSTSGGVSSWKCLPPLNKDVKVIKIGSADGSSWSYSEQTARIDSHLFIWNWTDLGSTDIYDSSAAIIINSDSPPDQTRKYTPDVKFSAPSGRVLPVAFASSNVSIDMSVKGVVVDDGVKYQAAGPLPENTKLTRVTRLASLSGKGIHPIYRTPYGDWSQVAIEGVDTSKTEMYLSGASITQRSVED